MGTERTGVAVSLAMIEAPEERDERHTMTLCG